MTPEQHEAENKRDRMANLHINSLTWKLVEMIEHYPADHEVKALASQLHGAMKRNVAANFVVKEMGIPSVPNFDAALEKAWSLEHDKRVRRNIHANNSFCEDWYKSGFLACWVLLNGGR
jgi:hypothetical protein